MLRRKASTRSRRGSPGQDLWRLAFVRLAQACPWAIRPTKAPYTEETEKRGEETEIAQIKECPKRQQRTLRTPCCQKHRSVRKQVSGNSGEIACHSALKVALCAWLDVRSTETDVNTLRVVSCQLAPCHLRGQIASQDTTEFNFSVKKKEKAQVTRFDTLLTSRFGPWTDPPTSKDNLALFSLPGLLSECTGKPNFPAHQQVSKQEDFSRSRCRFLPAVRISTTPLYKKRLKMTTRLENTFEQPLSLTDKKSVNKYQKLVSLNLAV